MPYPYGTVVLELSLKNPHSLASNHFIKIGSIRPDNYTYPLLSTSTQGYFTFYLGFLSANNWSPCEKKNSSRLGFNVQQRHSLAGSGSRAVTVPVSDHLRNYTFVQWIIWYLDVLNPMETASRVELDVVLQYTVLISGYVEIDLAGKWLSIWADCCHLTRILSSGTWWWMLMSRQKRPKQWAYVARKLWVLSDWKNTNLSGD